MDKRGFIGFALIGLVLTLWISYNSVTTRPVAPKTDSLKTQEAHASAETAQTVAPTQQVMSVQYGAAFDKFLTGNEEILTVENDLVEVKISSRGGTVREWRLKKFQSWVANDTVQLVSYDNPKGEFGISFTSQENRRVETRNLFFTLDYPRQNGQKIKISGEETVKITARLSLDNGASIVKTFTFYGNRYTADLGVKMNNMEQLATRYYEIAWTDGLRYQEKNSVDESNSAKALASIGGSIEELDAKDFNKPVKTQSTGKIDYIAIKNKYFGAAMIPQGTNSDRQMFLEGDKFGAEHGGMHEIYGMTFRQQYSNTSPEDKFTVYIGPLDYDIVKKYGLEAMVDLGWKWLVRPIGEWFMLPIFKGIHSFIPNYGLAIILFSILMKILLTPFSLGQMRSASKMKLLAPEIEKVREKYKDDMQTQQQETMRLYSEYGINPMGGCFPLLLQMPILYALWATLNSAIDLRHAFFFAWITDLASPDVLVALPFKLPLFGIDKISGLALLMGVTMFFQQKQTITDPRQKSMIYMMPVMFTLMFSGFPAGLNLYYFMFNVLSILHQWYITKFSKNQMTLEELKKIPKKEGWMAKKMREAQEIAAAQGRTVPGMDPKKQVQQAPKKKK